MNTAITGIIEKSDLIKLKDYIADNNIHLKKDKLNINKLGRQVIVTYLKHNEQFEIKKIIDDGENFSRVTILVHADLAKELKKHSVDIDIPMSSIIGCLLKSIINLWYNQFIYNNINRFFYEF